MGHQGNLKFFIYLIGLGPFAKNIQGHSFHGKSSQVVSLILCLVNAGSSELQITIM
jgi:hypothetical protein